MMSRFTVKTHSVVTRFTAKLPRWKHFATWCACVTIVAIFAGPARAQVSS